MPQALYTDPSSWSLASGDTDSLSSPASSDSTWSSSQGLVAKQGDTFAARAWFDVTTASPWKSEAVRVWTPLCSPFQNVCAGTAINQAVLTQRCNPSCLSLGLIYIILSGPRAQMHPGKGGDWAREKERLRPFSPGTGRGLRAELGNDLSVQRLGCLFAEEKLGRDWQQGCFCRFPCSWQVIMKLCQSIMDMDMPDYVDSLDSSYTMLEFENLRVLPNNTGEISVCFLLNNLYYLC